MGNGTASRVVTAAVLAIAIVGCDSSTVPQGRRAGTPLAAPRALDWYQARPEVLRAKEDPARARIWTLHGDGVDVYDANSDQKLRSVSLPEWIWANRFHACPPDLAIGPGGDAVVSSNVVPFVWRIDAATFQVSKHELTVQDDQGKDVGFSALTFSRQQGAFLGMNGMDGSLWRIDASLQRAQQIPLAAPVPGACALSVNSGAATRAKSDSFCAQTETGEWSIHFAPDFRSGYARPATCSARSLAPTARLTTTQTNF